MNHSRDMFGNDIYWSAIFGSALLDEKVWLSRSHEKVIVERSRSEVVLRLNNIEQP